MRKPKALLGLLSLLIALAACGVAGFIKWIVDPPPSHSTLTVSQPVCGTWQAVSGPRIGNGSMHSVALAAPDDIWAVGSQSMVFTSHAQAYIQHWDGQTWSSVETSVVGGALNAASSSLLDSTVVARDDVWAVGYLDKGATGNRGPVEETLVLHWNGRAWTHIPSPSPGSRYNVLYGVAAVSAQDIWAVGAYEDTNQKRHALITHWDGGQWTIAAIPNLDPLQSQLYDVAALSANDIWAVGYVTAAPHSLALHWDGKQW